MAANDFAWYSSTTGIASRVSYPATAAQTFEAGEPVTLIAAGTLSECLDDPADVAGIATHNTTDVLGVDKGVGYPVTVEKGGPDQTFKTNNFATDGAGTAAVPTIANIGDLAGFDLSGGVWTLDTGQDNLICEVVGVLDKDGRPMGHTSIAVGAGAIVLFRLI